MTAKQAIKARCLNCFWRNCTETKCPLFGVIKPQAGINRIEAICYYCYWCMNKNPINQCTCQNYSIYQYRPVAKGNIGVHFLPVSTSKARIDDNGDDCNTKTMSTMVQKMRTIEMSTVTILRRTV
jgi:hypothetical protein